MASLSRPEFNSFIESTLPDNSSRQISASDLRQSFFNLADSISNFNVDININSLNFGTESLRTTFAGEDSLVRKGANGFATQDNSAYGYASLQLTYTGLRNTAIGSYALSCASLGSDNVAVGVNALGGLTVGSGNVAVGNYSLLKKKSGNFNIAIGHGAGYVSHSDSDFKFNLGVYPEASGDCETTHTFDKSPLLHGDLSSLQLAIAASGFRGDEKLSVSGNIIPYESGVGFSLGSGEYRWDAYVQDLYVSGNITTQNPVYSLSLSDGFSAPEAIVSNETVFISGISGIKTEYDTSSNLMRVSAEPLSGVLTRFTEGVSGYLLQELNLLSGLAPAFGGDDGLIWNVSGWAKQYADGVGISAGAYTHWRVQDESSVGENITDPSTSENTVTFAGVSGNFTNYRSDTNTLEISAKPLSGVLQNKIDASGTAISGWANYNFFDEDGYVGLVSGYLEDWALSTFNLSIPGGSYTHWTISDGTNIDQIQQGDPNVVFGGVSGIETNYRGDTDTLEISALPISGMLQHRIDASGAVVSGLIVTNDSRASGLILTNDSRASGLIDLVSGILTITPGSGLTKVFDGGDTYFHTDGSGNFEKIILRKTDASLLDPVGQLVSTTEGGRNNVINASGYLQIPAVQEHYDLPEPHTVGDSGVYFADSHIYQSNGTSWSKPTIIEGFMAEDLDPPTNYLNETSGKIVTRVLNNGILQTGPEDYIINRDRTFAASGGYFLMAMRVNNEYRPVWSTCSGCPDCP